MNPKSKAIFIMLFSVLLLGAVKDSKAQQILQGAVPAAAQTGTVPACPTNVSSTPLNSSSNSDSIAGPLAVTVGTSAQYTIAAIEENQPLIWTVNQIIGGDTEVGTISSSGLYSAPTTMPPCSTLILTASNPAKPWIWKSLQITLQTTPSGPAPIPSVVSVDQMGIVMQNPHILGRDGTWSAVINGKSYWSFNDTSINAPNTEGQNFISNTRSWTDNLDASHGIDLNHDHVDSIGMPTELMPFTAEEAAFNAAHGNGSGCSTTIDPLCGEAYAIWPGPVIPVPNSKTGEAYHFYLLILRGGPISGWNVIGLGIAHEQNGVVTRPIITPGTANPTLMWQGTYTTAYGNGGMLQGGILYMTGCDPMNIFGYHMCNMGRVSLKDILNPGAWTYYNGNTQQWVNDPTQATMLFYGVLPAIPSFSTRLLTNT